MRTSPAPDERRNARLFVTGAVVSSVGTTAMTLAAGIWVQELTGDASLAALVGACVWAPTLLGPGLGPLVDRRRRQPLLVQANLGAAAVVLALLLVPGVAGPWLVFVAMAAYGVGFVVLDAAEAALLAGAVARLRAPEPPPSPTAGTRWRDEVVDGYRALRQMPGAWRLTLLGATALTLHALASGTTFALVSDVMGRSRAPALWRWSTPAWCSPAAPSGPGPRPSRSGGRFVEALLEGVPAQGGALDADRELHDAPQRLEVAQLHVGCLLGRGAVPARAGGVVELGLVDRHHRLEGPRQVVDLGQR